MLLGHKTTTNKQTRRHVTLYLRLFMLLRVRSLITEQLSALSTCSPCYLCLMGFQSIPSFNISTKSYRQFNSHLSPRSDQFEIWVANGSEQCSYNSRIPRRWRCSRVPQQLPRSATIHPLAPAHQRRRRDSSLRSIYTYIIINYYICHKDT